MLFFVTFTPDDFPKREQMKKWSTFNWRPQLSLSTSRFDAQMNSSSEIQKLSGLISMYEENHFVYSTRNSSARVERACNREGRVELLPLHLACYTLEGLQELRTLVPVTPYMPYLSKTTLQSSTSFFLKIFKTPSLPNLKI